MSQPDPKVELHELVEEYCHDWCGEDMLIPYLHEQIDYPKERDWLFEEFMEWVGDKE